MRALLSCKLVDQQAVRYFFDAGLAERIKAGMKRHLATCPRCRRKLELFERVWRWDGERRASRQDGLSVADDEATMSSLST
jgi:hypothetical protein